MVVDQQRDRRVVQRVLQGEQELFRDLVEQYQGRIYALNLGLVRDPSAAEDLTQQTFVEAFNDLRRYDQRRRFLTWLMRIATNNCKDYLKSHKRREHPLSSEKELSGALFSGVIPSPEEAVASGELAVHLERALGRLKPKYRIPLVLKDVEEMSYREMQKILDLPLTTLKIRVVRGRAQLRKAIQWTAKN